MLSSASHSAHAALSLRRTGFHGSRPWACAWRNGRHAIASWRKERLSRWHAIFMMSSEGRVVSEGVGGVNDGATGGAVDVDLSGDEF